MKSKSLTLFLIALATFPSAIASAGEFRGVLTQGGTPVPGAEIAIKSGSNEHKTTTDKSGFYRVFVPELGSCTLTVKLGSGPELPPLTVTSYERFVQNNLIVEIIDGKATLTKR